MTNLPALFRTIARKGAALLPRAVLRRIAEYRFGYTTGGRPIEFRRADGPQGPIVIIDEELRLTVTPDFLPDLQFHFVDNGQSRDEIGAFMDAARMLPAGALLFDVGAHRGLFSLVHCAAAPDRRAVLFEPSWSLAADAARLLSLNGFHSRAEIRRCGVGARIEQRRLVEDALGFARDAEDRTAGTEVEFTTLDEEWRRIGAPPSIVKIDVEGAEAEVIRGASQVLRSARPVIFLELHMDELERRKESVAQLLRELTANGYCFTDPNGTRRSASSITRSLRAIVRLVARSQGTRVKGQWSGGQGSGRS